MWLSMETQQTRDVFVAGPPESVNIAATFTQVTRQDDPSCDCDSAGTELKSGADSWQRVMNVS